MSWASDLPVVEGTLTGKRREAAIAEHIRWLESRERFAEFKPTRQFAMLDWLAARRAERQR